MDETLECHGVLRQVLERPAVRLPANNAGLTRCLRFMSMAPCHARREVRSFATMRMSAFHRHALLILAVRYLLIRLAPRTQAVLVKERACLLKASKCGAGVPKTSHRVHRSINELVTVDDGGVKGRCAQNVKALIDGGVSAIIGLTSGAGAEACMPVVTNSRRTHRRPTSLR